MTALSIRQPWAWLILHRGKDIENRNWHSSHRGYILVHAAKGMTMQEYEDAQEFAYLVADAQQKPRSDLQLPPFADLERGGIVGRINLIGCVDSDDSPWFVGRYGFVLRNPEPLPFRACRGQLGFFQVNETAGV